MTIPAEGQVSWSDQAVLDNPGISVDSGGKPEVFANVSLALYMFDSMAGDTASVAATTAKNKCVIAAVSSQTKGSLGTDVRTMDRF